MDNNHEENQRKEDEVCRKRAMTKAVMLSIKPGLVYENCYGIFRLSIENDQLTDMTGKKKLFGMLLSFSFTVTFGFLFHLPSSLSDTRAIVDVMDAVPNAITLVQYVTTVFTAAFLFNRSTVQIFNNLAYIDAKLRLDLKDDFHNKARKNNRNCLLLLTFVIAFSVCLDFYTDETVLFYKVISVLIYLEQNIEILMFCQMVFLLRSRLVVINEYLNQFVGNSSSTQSSIFLVMRKQVVSQEEFNFIGRASSRNTKVRDLAEMYNITAETCALINEIFEFQMFMNLVSTFTHTVMAIWTSIYYSRTPENFSGQLVTAVLWCLVTLLSVIFMSFTCERLLSSRNNTKLLVNDIIMDYELPTTMRVQAKAFMELIEACPMQIVVYDMFSIDIKLLLKFVSVATTYLIVIIQLSHFV